MSKGSNVGRGLLFHSCLEDIAHRRLPNPTGNGEPRGKGKTNKGNGTTGEGARGWMERIRRGGVYRVQGSCVRWCSVGVALIFLLLQSR